MDALERVIRPIVEGQLRSFANDHPKIVEAVDWFKPRRDKKVTLVNSIAKRIVRDLLCPETRVRLMAAVLAQEPDAAVDSAPDTAGGGAEGSGGTATADPVAGVEL